MQRINKVVITAALLFLLLLAGAAVLAQNENAFVGWWVLGSGGGTSTGGNVKLDDTIGEPIVGLSSGGVVKLYAGFQQGGVTVPMPANNINLPIIIDTKSSLAAARGE